MTHIDMRTFLCREDNFGHLIHELGARMDDFSLEFLNMAERSFGE